MFDAIDIIRRNADTYYAFESKQKISRKPVLFAITLVSLGSASAITSPTSEFLSGALSAQAILVGFSFNALFYLVTNRLVSPKTWLFIEHELRFHRLIKLSDEIFDNISYFNLITIVSIAITLILLFFSGGIDHSFSIAQLIGNPGIAETVEKTGHLINECARRILIFSLVFTLIESLISFSRIIYRVRFYFRMLKVMNDGNDTATAEKR